jgi:thiosulfate/3-mercaptopyruvate sulfurtransferase
MLLSAALMALELMACGSGSSGPGRPHLSSAFVLPPASLPAALHGTGVVLMSAQSALEIAPPGFVNHAIAVDVDALTRFSESPGGFVNFAGWAAMFGALGVSTSSEVIVYDDGEMKFAARVRFLLFYFGVRSTFIVNGGFAAMQPLIAAHQLTVTAPGTLVPATFTVSVQDSPIHLLQRGEVAAVLGNPAVTLLDVRTLAEFKGCKLLPGITRGGHIPGARNLPVEQLLTPQIAQPQFSLLDSPLALLAVFTGFGLHTTDRIIVYCQDGAKSSLGSTALIDAGFTDVSLYYLSYLDWQKDPADPVEAIRPCD